MNDKINPQGYNIKADPTNTNPFWGDDPMPGEKETLTVEAGTTSATSLPAGSTPTASVKNSGTDYHAVLDFEFGIPKGEQGTKGDKGEKGDPGLTGPHGETGPEGPQGPQGPKGDTGPKGEPGAQGPAGTVSIGAVTATAGETASAEVTNSGTDTNAELNFAFTLPRGEKGDTGPQGEPGPKGDAGQVPAKTGDANDLVYISIHSFSGEFKADISIAEITGSMISETTSQNIDVQINPHPSFIIPGEDEEGNAYDAYELYTPVLVTFSNNGINYCLQAIAGYSKRYQEFSMKLPNPDVRIRTLDDGETRVCVARITKLTYLDSNGSSESLNNTVDFLYLSSRELHMDQRYLRHSHTI